MKPGPRIFCIPATASPMVAVLRRGPTDWFHVGRWDVRQWTWEPGAWFRGRLFPQKCDVSPDGRWLAYSAQKPSADWPAGTIYEAISRLPWLHALAAWEAGTTYTRGFHFDETAGRNDLGSPDVGDASPCLRRYGLRLNLPAQFVVERRRGWSETTDTDERAEGDTWDERRRVRMVKTRPGGPDALEVEGSYAAFRNMPDYRDGARYRIVDGERTTPLDEAQWADWTSSGYLLLATWDGRLQGRALDGDSAQVVFEQDLTQLEPEPAPPPEWAHEW